MTIEQMTAMSEILLVVAILLAIVAVIIYFKFDINRAWHLLTGRRIKPKEPKPEKLARPLKNGKKIRKTAHMTETIMLDGASVTEKTTVIGQTQTQKGKPTITEKLISEMVAAKEGNKTVILPRETSLLDDNTAETKLLQEDEGTVLLSQIQQKKESALRKEKKPSINMEVVQDITFIHTDIRIG